MKLRGTIAFAAGFAVTLALGWLAFPRMLYRARQQPLQFNHKLHTGDKVGYKCADCHSLGADGRFSGIPGVATCAGCHAEPVTQSAEERRLVNEYVKPNREIPWLVYSRQPENARFPHAVHIQLAHLNCEQCHGGHGRSERLRTYYEDRVNGYSRDVWGPQLVRAGYRAAPQAHSGDEPSPMKMDDCIACHRTKGLEMACLACHK